MIEHVRDARTGELAAVISYADHRVGRGVNFLTDPSLPLQVARMLRSRGERVAAHRHDPSPRTIAVTAEVLIVTKGSLALGFHGIDSQVFEVSDRILRAGDIAVLLACGHSIEYLEDGTELIEVKQGPFMDDKVML